MAAGTFNIHNNGLKGCLLDASWTGDDFYAILVIGYTQTLSHTQYSHVSSYEIADGDYTPVSVDSKTTALVSGGPATALDSADITWGDPVDIEADHMIILKGDYAAPTSGDVILGSVELEVGTTKASIGGEFTVQLASTGLLVGAQA